MSALMQSKVYPAEETERGSYYHKVPVIRQNIQRPDEHYEDRSQYRGALTSRLSSERIFGSLGEFPPMNKRQVSESSHNLSSMNKLCQQPVSEAQRKRVHGPYTCEDCGKVLKRSSSLSNHKLIHKNVKAYRCDKCGARFLRKSDLGKHFAIHTGSKPYVCNICDKSFSQSSNMLTHKRRHTGVKPFKCDYCSKSFYRKVDVKRHEIVHNLRDEEEEKL